MKLQRICINKTQVVSELILTSFVIVLLGYHLRFFEAFFSNALFLIIGGTSSVLCLIYGKKKQMCRAVIFASIYSYAGLISYAYNGNADIQELLWPIGYMGIGLILVNFRVSTIFTSLCYFAYMGIMFSLMIFDRPEASFSFLRFSRNTISVLSLLFFSMHMIAAYRARKSVSIVYPIVMLIVNCLAMGRSGIFTAILCNFLFIAYVYKDDGSHLKKGHMVVTAGIILLVFLVGGLFFPQVLAGAIHNFSVVGLRSQRIVMWNDYFMQVGKEFTNIIFGAKIQGSPILDEFHENLHNAFIMLHAKYGMMGIMLCGGLLIRTIRRLFLNHNIYLMTPLILILFRMQFDYTNFNGVLDFILIFYLIYIDDRTNMRRRPE